MPLVVTATGLPTDERRRAESVCLAMGAVFSPSLTNSTTHLIAACPGSEKYKVASSLGIGIVRVSWIDACLALIENDALSMSEIEKITDLHRLRPLEGLIICLTGFDVRERQNIEANSKSLGAQFATDLSKQCTHLIATAAKGKKFDFAVKHGVLVVSKAWLYSTAEHVNESNYTIPQRNLSTAATEQRPPIRQSNVTNHPLPSRISQVKNQGSTSDRNEFENVPPAPRNTIANATVGISGAHKATSENVAISRGAASHIPNQTSIVMSAFNSSENPERASVQTRQISASESPCINPAARSVDNVQAEKKTPLQSDETASDTKEVKSCKASTATNETKNNRKSVNASTRRKSLAVGTNSTPKKGEQSSQGGKRMSAFAKRRSSIRVSIAASGIPRFGTLFDGLHFAIEGFDEADTEILSEEIQCQDGEVHLGMIQDALKSMPIETLVYLICPLGEGPISSWSKDISARIVVVSECWIEQCLEDGYLYGVDESILFQAIRYKQPSQLFVVGVTGHEGLAREHIRKLTQAMGGTFTEAMSKKNTHLIAFIRESQSPPSLKLTRAKEWGIEVVSVDWLFQCAILGQLIYPLPMDDTTQASPPQHSGTSTSSSKKRMKSFSGQLPEDQNIGEIVESAKTSREAVLGILNEGRPPEICVPLLVSESTHDDEDIPAEGASRPSPNTQIFPQNAKCNTFSEKERAYPAAGKVPDMTNALDPPPHLPSMPSSPEPLKNNITQAESISNFGTGPENANHHQQKVVADANEEIESEFSMNHVQSVTDNIPISSDNKASGLFRIEFDTTDALKAVPSPVTNRLLHDLTNPADPTVPLEDSFAVSLQRAAHNISTSKPTAPLHGVVVSISERAIAYRHDAVRICRALGGEFAHGFNEERCTHLVHTGGAGGTSDKDFKRAKASGKEIVSPAWLNVCYDRGRRVSEKEFPWTVDVEKGLWKNMEISEGTIEAKENHSNPTKSSDKPAFDDKKSLPVIPVEAVPKSNAPNYDEAKIADYFAALGKSVATSSTTTKPRQSTWAKQRSIGPENDDKTSLLQAPPAGTSHFPTDILNDDPAELESFTQIPQVNQNNITDPYASVVIYDDPRARAVKRQMIETLEKGTEWASKRAKLEGWQSSFKENEPAEPKQRYFMLTGVQSKLRLSLVEKIIALGGNVVKSEVWDDSTTHLVCDNPVPTEKCFGICAKGAWLIQVAYVEKSFAAGRFLDEDDFEWAKAANINPTSAQRIAHASKAWRIKLGNFRRHFHAPLAGVFEHWVVLIAMKSLEKAHSFKRVLVSGGAAVTCCTMSNLNEAVDKASFTYCFTDMDAENNQVLSGLQKSGTSVVTLQFICDYLLDPNSLMTRKYPPPRPDSKRVQIAAGWASEEETLSKRRIMSFTQLIDASNVLAIHRLNPITLHFVEADTEVAFWRWFNRSFHSRRTPFLLTGLAAAALLVWEWQRSFNSAPLWIKCAGILSTSVVLLFTVIVYAFLVKYPQMFINHQHYIRLLLYACLCVWGINVYYIAFTVSHISLLSGKFFAYFYPQCVLMLLSSTIVFCNFLYCTAISIVSILVARLHLFLLQLSTDSNVYISPFLIYASCTASSAGLMYKFQKMSRQVFAYELYWSERLDIDVGAFSGELLEEALKQKRLLISNDDASTLSGGAMVRSELRKFLKEVAVLAMNRERGADEANLKARNFVEEVQGNAMTSGETVVSSSAADDIVMLPGFQDVEVLPVGFWPKCRRILNAMDFRFRDPLLESEFLHSHKAGSRITFIGVLVVGVVMNVCHVFLDIETYCAEVVFPQILCSPASRLEMMLVRFVPMTTVSVVVIIACLAVLPKFGVSVCRWCYVGFGIANILLMSGVTVHFDMTDPTDFSGILQSYTIVQFVMFTYSFVMLVSEYCVFATGVFLGNIVALSFDRTIAQTGFVLLLVFVCGVGLVPVTETLQTNRRLFLLNQIFEDLMSS
ncbi:DNA topoisomerase 2-binding protein 1 [Chytriomyces hyalinus]|nr:DNA topoisomerase 2-binding protein 1 [Chytriomyces hyalinus]